MSLDTLGLVPNPRLGEQRPGASEVVLPWRGKVLMLLEAGVSARERLVIDLEGAWTVEAVRWEGRSIPFRYRSGRIECRLKGIKPRDLHAVEVHYSGHLVPALKPPWQDGVVVRRDSLGFPRLGMTCQGSGARSWWPCLDDARTEPDSVSLTMTFPAYASAESERSHFNTSETTTQTALMDMVANGRRVGDTLLGSRRTVTWKVTQPINLYNITFNIGRYVRFVQPFVDMNSVERELKFYVMPEDQLKARTHMAQVADLMSCYEDKLGPYPFWTDGYKVVQTSYLGMEHQSAIAYGNGFRNNEWGFDFILVHESGHEWWGNSVSASDPADWWIHEGLTTLMEAVYLECRDGHRREADAYMLRIQRKIQNRKPMQGPRGRRYADHDADIYYKGAWMFQSLRNSPGMEEVWNEALRTAYRKFAGRTLCSEQMIAHWASALDPRFAGTFRWWLDHAELPVLEWSLQANPGDTTRIMLRYRWAPSAKGFHLPLLTASGHRLDPVPGRWQTTEWKARDRAITQEEKRSTLRPEMSALAQRYLIQVQAR
jgi:aminopeptidase N